MSDENPMKNERFRLWFGDSKVVDENGDPLVVYHGTTADFDAFDQEKIGSKTDNGLFGKGFYFTPRHGNGGRQWGTAGAYASGIGGNIIPVFLRIERPLIVPSAEWGRTEVDRSKYDGVIVEEAASGRRGPVVEVVAFHSEQIKSAIGNSGAFDLNNPDLCDSLVSAEKAPIHWWEIQEDGLSI